MSRPIGRNFRKVTIYIGIPMQGFRPYFVGVSPRDLPTVFFRPRPQGFFFQNPSLTNPGNTDLCIAVLFLRHYVWKKEADQFEEDGGRKKQGSFTVKLRYPGRIFSRQVKIVLR